MYGLRSTKIIITIVIILLTLNLASANNLFKAYNIIIDFENESYTLNNINTGLAWESKSTKMAATHYELAPNTTPQEFLFTYKVLHGYEEHEVLKKGYFFVPTSYFITPPPRCFNINNENEVQNNNMDEECASYIELEPSGFSISIPYAPKGETIMLFDNTGKEILALDITSFSNYCGDGRCSIFESFETCPQDCDETPKIFQNTFFASTYNIQLTEDLIVYTSPDLCKQDLSGLNCVEDLQHQSNIFIRTESGFTFNRARTSFNFFFEKDSKIILKNNNEQIQLSNNDFKISFDDLRNFAYVSKEFDYNGMTCVETFNPNKQKNPLERHC